MGKYLFSDQQDQRREDRRPKPKPRTGLPQQRKPLPKAIKKIRKQSKKLKEIYPTYQAARDQYMSTHPACEACALHYLPECNGIAEDLHHVAGRGINLCNVKYFMAISRNHHNFIKEHSAEAAAHGLTINAPLREEVLNNI